MLLLFYMLRFVLRSVPRIINCSICHLLAQKKKRMRYCDGGLQHICMLVITPVMKCFNILKHFNDKQSHEQGCYLCQILCLTFLISFIALKHKQKAGITTSSWPKNNELCWCDKLISDWSSPCLQRCIHGIKSLLIRKKKDGVVNFGVMWHACFTLAAVVWSRSLKPVWDPALPTTWSSQTAIHSSDGLVCV